jgi:hypothetical protein
VLIKKAADYLIFMPEALQRSCYHAGEIRCLADTNMDLRVPRVLAHVLNAAGGIDHNYCINQCIHGGLTFIAR